MKVSSKGMAILNVKALTWFRDSHGLFDYESFQLTKNTLKIEGDSTIIRYGDELSVKSEYRHTEAEEIEELANVSYTNGTLILNKYRKILYS
jgi:hypothetical protein